MKFTLGELRMMQFPLQKIANKELPIKVSWQITKFLKQINGELELIEFERIKLVHKYKENSADEDIKGVEVKVSDENKENFHKEFIEFLSSEVEIDCQPINISNLGDIELSSSDLLMLNKYVVE